MLVLKKNCSFWNDEKGSIETATKGTRLYDILTKDAVYRTREFGPYIRAKKMYSERNESGIFAKWNGKYRWFKIDSFERV